MILEEWNDLVASNQSNEIHCWNRVVWLFPMACGMLFLLVVDDV